MPTRKPKPATNPHAKLIERAKAIISDPSQKIGNTFHVEEFLKDKKWDSLAVIVQALEDKDEHALDRVIVDNDSRTLADSEVQAACKELAEHLESEHLVGYLFLLLDHVAAAAREWNRSDCQVYEIRRFMLAHNAHAADDASKHLINAARKDLRKGVAR